MPFGCRRAPLLGRGRRHRIGPARSRNRNRNGTEPRRPRPLLSPPLQAPRRRGRLRNHSHRSPSRHHSPSRRRSRPAAGVAAAAPTARPQPARPTPPWPQPPWLIPPWPKPPWPPPPPRPRAEAGVAAATPAVKIAATRPAVKNLRALVINCLPKFSSTIHHLHHIERLWRGASYPRARTFPQLWREQERTPSGVIRGRRGSSRPARPMSRSISSRSTKRWAGDGRRFLEAGGAGASFAVLGGSSLFRHSIVSIPCAVVFVRFMPSNRAANRRAYNGMMTRVVAGDSAHGGSLETALGAGGIWRGDRGKDQCGANIKHLHWGGPFRLPRSTRRFVTFCEFSASYRRGKPFSLESV